MDQDIDTTPTFWLQLPPTTARRRRLPSSPIIDPAILIILLPILVLLFLFFFIPPFLSHTSHILKPSSVKSTWDSLNIFLVLFAIFCGVLARKNDDVSALAGADQVNNLVNESSSNNVMGSGSGTGMDSGLGRWGDDPDRKTGGLRSSSSYPDLRQESAWESGESRFRFFDDFGVDLYSSPATRCYRSTPVSGWSRRSDAEEEVKEIAVDFEVRRNVVEVPVKDISPENVPAPPPSPPPRRPSMATAQHTFRSVGLKEDVEVLSEIGSDEMENFRSPPPPPPPPPPPYQSRHKHKKLERKVSDATKEIATAIASLYNQRKRKNKRKLRIISDNFDSSPPSEHPGRSSTQQPSQTLPPPPPPPPPPPSMFHNMFKKGSKYKRIHSVPAPVPPPPPPLPPSSIFNNLFKSGGKSKLFQSSSTAPPPPPPSSIINNLFKNETRSKRFNSSAASPPPPPPPPPPMTPPRYFVPAKSKQLSKRNTQAQPPSPTKSEPYSRRPATSGKPPLPTKSSSYYDRDDFLHSGSQSPLIPMPPPPPPFSMPAIQFEVQGDFVRIRSANSSVCSSPDRESVDFRSTIIEGQDSIGPTGPNGPGPKFYPSPDVNAKADSFISRLKDEWRMEKEKISSIKDNVLQSPN